MSTIYGIDVSAYRGFVYVALSGEIDLSNVDAVRTCIVGHLSQPPATGLVIDLADTTFLDSMGISMLVTCRKIAKDAGIPFGVIKAQGEVLRVLDLADVYEYLNADGVVVPRMVDGSALRGTSGSAP